MKLAPDSSDLMAWLKDYNAHEPPAPTAPGQFAPLGDQYSNFPWQLGQAIENSDDIGKMMPLITQGLASPNPRMREQVARALAQRQQKNNGNYQWGNQLGNQFLPIMATLLDDSDPQVQQAAMGCLFWMSGDFKKPLQERELHLWATFVLKQNPNLYPTQLKEYKAWREWQKVMISRTQAELDQVRKGIIDYEHQYGGLPSVGDYRDLVQILQGTNPNKTVFITCDPWELDSNGELIDAWGTRLCISLADPKNPQLQSAGLDKRWNTADDLSATETP